MPHRVLIRHCIWVLLVSVAGSSAWAQTAPPTASVTRAYTVFLRGTPIGRENLTVRSDTAGLTVTSQSTLGAPLNIVMRHGEVVYRPDLTPISLTLDATINQKNVTLRTSFANGSAVSEGNDAGTPVRNVSPLQPRTFVMPDIFFGSVEALGRQLAIVNGLPNDLHAFVAPGVDIGLRVQDASRGRVAIGATSMEVYRYDLVFSNATGELTAHLMTELNGGLLLFSVPSQALEVIREDLTTATARTLVFANPTDEAVSIPANGFSLAGTLTRPPASPSSTPPGGSAPRLPAIVVLGGSGAEERDGYVGGVPVIGQIAGALAEAGYLVVRYDRRGAGQSGGRAESATLTDYAEDARAAVRWLAARGDVDIRRISILGHSESAWVALLAASQDNRIAAVVSIAAPSQTGNELVLDQQRMALNRLNLSPGEREAKVALQKQIQAAVLSGKGWEGVPADVRRQADTPWFQSLLAYDPAKVLDRVRQPLLFVHGQLDKQIAVDNVDRLSEAARKANRSKVIDVVSVRGVNHLLVPAVTGEVSEYGTLANRNVSRDVTMAIGNWLNVALPAR